MADLIRPVVLFADSRLLFWKRSGHYFLKSIIELVPKSVPGAAYLGASNDCQPEFFSLFESAMALVGVTHCRAIPLQPSATDLAFLRAADLILLGGGDVRKGWDNFCATGIKEIVLECYQRGAILIGISAGAVQLGLAGWDTDFPSGTEKFPTFQIVPYLIDVHAEADDWPQLKQALLDDNFTARGIGIRAGGGLIFYPDQRLASVRFPASLFTKHGAEILREKIF